MIRLLAVSASVLLFANGWAGAQPIAESSGRSCKYPGAAAADAALLLDRLNWKANAGRGATESSEFGVLVFQRSDGRFGWTRPNETPPGRNAGWDPPLRIREGNNWRLPSGETVVGTVHTHPPDGGDLGEHNSEVDRAIAEKEDLTSWVVTPTGRLVRYDTFGPDLVGMELEETATSAGCRDVPAQTTQPPPTPAFGCGSCAVIASDPHILTHDGRHIVLQVAGEFVAVETTQGDLTVQARFEPYRQSPSVSVMTAVAIGAGGDRIGVYSDAPHILVDGEDAEAAFGAELADGVKLAGGTRLRRLDHGVEVETAAGDLLRVQRLGRPWLDLLVGLSAARRGEVAGLLGDFNGVSTDDIVARGGAVVALPGASSSEDEARIRSRWAESWRILPDGSLFDYSPGRGPADYQILDFPTRPMSLPAGLAGEKATAAADACDAAGVSAPVLRDICIYDVAVSGDEAFISAARELGGALEALASVRGSDAPPGWEPSVPEVSGRAEGLPQPDLEANLALTMYGAYAEAVLTGRDVEPASTPADHVLLRGRHWVSADRKDWPHSTFPSVTLHLPGQAAPRIAGVRVETVWGEPYRIGDLRVEASTGLMGEDFTPIADVHLSQDGSISDVTLAVFAATPARRLRLTLLPQGENRRIVVDTIEAFEPEGETDVYDALVESFGVPGGR